MGDKLFYQEYKYVEPKDKPLVFYRFFYKFSNKKNFNYLPSLNFFNLFITMDYSKKNFFYTFLKYISNTDYSFLFFVNEFNTNVINLIFFKIFLIKNIKTERTFINLFYNSRILLKSNSIFRAIFLVFKILKMNYRFLFKTKLKIYNKFVYFKVLTLFIFATNFEKSLVYRFFHLQKRKIKHMNYRKRKV